MDKKKEATAPRCATIDYAKCANCQVQILPAVLIYCVMNAHVINRQEGVCPKCGMTTVAMLTSPQNPYLLELKMMPTTTDPTPELVFSKE